MKKLLKSAMVQCAEHVFCEQVPLPLHVTAIVGVVFSTSGYMDHSSDLFNGMLDSAMGGIPVTTPGLKQPPVHQHNALSRVQPPNKPARLIWRPAAGDHAQPGASVLPAAVRQLPRPQLPVLPVRPDARGGPDGHPGGRGEGHQHRPQQGQAAAQLRDAQGALGTAAALMWGIAQNVCRTAERMCGLQH
jgi:hypothetical protein